MPTVELNEGEEEWINVGSENDLSYTVTAVMQG